MGAALPVQFAPIGRPNHPKTLPNHPGLQPETLTTLEKRVADPEDQLGSTGKRRAPGGRGRAVGLSVDEQRFVRLLQRLRSASAEKSRFCCHEFREPSWAPSWASGPGKCQQDYPRLLNNPSGG